MKTFAACMAGCLATGCLPTADPCSVGPVGDNILGDSYTDCGFFGVFQDPSRGAVCVRDAFAAGEPFLFVEQKWIRDTTMTLGTVHLDGRVLFLYEDIAVPSEVTAVECLRPQFSEKDGEIVCANGAGDYTMCSPDGPSDGIPEPWHKGQPQ